eukprot:m51a1_g7971 hypothetical protein (903) ;mRNA; r:6046-9087
MPSPVLSLVLICALANAAAGSPAFPGPYDVRLPDGSPLRVWARGDEFTGPRFVDAAGREVLLSPDGSASFAPGAPGQRRGVGEHEEFVEELRRDRRRRRAEFSEALGAARRSRPASTEPLVLVLVQYDDYHSSPGTIDRVQALVFDAGSGRGDTINGYFGIQSNRRFQFARARESSGVADDGVIGPVTVNCPWAHQSAWGSNELDGLDGDCLARAALMAAADFLDLETLDADGDGVLAGSELHVVLVVAGGEAAALTPAGLARCPHVWGHMQPGGPAGLRLTAQNVTFGEHVVVGEGWGDCTAPMGSGVLAHELGHSLGLPDLYDQDEGASVVGQWCLMDVGMWNNNGHNPAMMSPFCRQYLGWLEPRVVPRTSTAAITLLPVAIDPGAVLQFGDNPGGVDWEWNVRSGAGEYFLVENRQRVGCDKYAPGGGVVVWHVNEAAAPTSNHASAVAQVARIQRRSAQVLSTGVWGADVLASSERRSLRCGASGTPNSLLDNSTASCVSLSASVNTASLSARVEPWTDAECSLCAFGQGGVEAPTRQYSYLEAYGFAPVPADGAHDLVFAGGYSQVPLPWAVTFGGVPYDRMFVSQRGWINFAYVNDAETGAGAFPMAAPTLGSAATAVRLQCLECRAPYPEGPCCVVQWQQGGLTTQAVLAQQGEIYYVYSGSREGIASAASVSTGAAWSSVPGGLWSSWRLEDPAVAPVALRLAPRDAEPIRLPLFVHFATSGLSPAVWSHVTCARLSDGCCGPAGGVLAFATEESLNRNAMTNAIDVSGCLAVSVSVFIGSLGGSAARSPASPEVSCGRMYNVPLAPLWVPLGPGLNAVTVAVPPTATTLYLVLNLRDVPGTAFADDLNVTCTSYRLPAQPSLAAALAAPAPRQLLAVAASVVFYVGSLAWWG